VATRPTFISVPAARPRRKVSVEVAEHLRHLDYLLLAAISGLVAYGLWVLQTVTRDDELGDPGYYVVRQAIFVVVGLVVFAVTVAVSPEVYRRVRHLMFLSVLALMVIVFVAGPSVNGARRWIDLGAFQLQPSELGKLVLILFLAALVTNRAKDASGFGTTVAALATAAAPALLVFFQPDFGTALVYGAATIGVLYFGGIRWPYLVGIAVFAGALSVAVLWLLPASGFEVLKPYQKERLVGFLDPQADPSGTTYNVNQAITAVGAGGLDGRGVEGATQTRRNFLPEHSTDFVFAALAEQRGFLGAAILLLLYAIVIWRGIKIVALADSLYSSTVAGAIVAALMFQIFLNVGMNVGIAPITGIPLPFISYGGSSMLTSLAMIGVLQAIHVRGQRATARRR
jgi:rod shape determining protein RodA